ncbi:MAG: glycosyltransferase [Candidatus Omnitrophica bacterium]|nr:glycosyltransferase [Candidatus Omnitrophota bacterium]
MERCTVIVNTRDKFSTTTRCLETLIANTPELHDLIVVVGGAPEHLKREWTEKFGERAQFIFRPTFLNQPQARNIGLREAKTRLAALLDNDNFVRPGWLAALLECERATGAVLVVPVILETPEVIHTAGNDLYVSHINGEAYGYKILRFYGMRLGEQSNLQREPTDYAELHCQLVQVEPTLRLGACDEQIIEVGEVDQGLTFARAGLPMWFEPKSVVHFALRHPMTADDIKLFEWRWNIKRVHDGYQYFQRKWHMDVSEYGTFRDWLVSYNSQLGLLPRFWPTAAALRLDGWLGRVRAKALGICRIPKYRFRTYKKRRLGYYEWTAGVLLDGS